MLFSTNYFGSIPYFQALAQFPKITIDLHELYKKQTWRNRTEILESNGPLLLSIPVNRPDGGNSVCGEIRIENIKDWRKDHWKAIESAYTHAPYFFYYGEQIKDLIYHEENFLFKFNEQILKQILLWLDLEIEIFYTEKYYPPESLRDFRVSLDKKKYAIPQERYIQVFSDKMAFVPNLSIIDLLMNQGPLARNYILPQKESLG